MSVPYLLPRGTRAALNTLAAANGLVANQPYWLTDESRVVVATSVSAYSDVPNGTDLAGKAPKLPQGQTITSSATVTPTFADDYVVVSAQAAALALANPTGTAAEEWGISIRIKDNGTARAITFGTNYRAVGVTLPTTTVAGKWLRLGIIWNATDSKWDVVAVVQQ